MHRPHRRARRLGFGLAAEGDQVERAQRAPEAAPEVAAIVGVIGDAHGDQRMGDLEQHRRPPPSKGVTGELPTLRITLSGAK